MTLFVIFLEIRDNDFHNNKIPRSNEKIKIEAKDLRLMLVTF